MALNSGEDLMGARAVGRLLRRGIAISLGLGAIGCGSGGLPSGAVPPVPASGNVYYHGKPLAKGTVLVVPDNEHPAAGEIKEGRFILTTYETDDGAVPGKHKVAVIATEEAKGKSGESTTKSILPARYASVETSNLVVEIPAQGSAEIKIEVD
jgi:hypothetical protein